MIFPTADFRMNRMGKMDRMKDRLAKVFIRSVHFFPYGYLLDACNGKIREKRAG